MVQYARKFPGGNSPVHIAAVATEFSSGQYPLHTKLEEACRTVADGAGEIDTVIDRCALLAGDHAKVFDEIAATKETCSSVMVGIVFGIYFAIRAAEMDPVEALRHE